MLTPLKLFTCTLSAKLEINDNISDLAEHLEPQGSILAFNTNFIHKAQPDYEKYLKKPKEPKLKTSGNGYRKQQGDGSCFQSCIEFTVKINHPDIPNDKVYKSKLYSRSGEVQIHGIILSDYSDGFLVIETLASFLNTNILVSGYPMMLNYKCNVTFNNTQEMLDLQNICDYINESESSNLPYPLLETHLAIDGSQSLAIRFKIGEKYQRISIWRSGKINIIGAKSQESVEKIYNYLNMIIPNFIIMAPVKDISVD